MENSGLGNLPFMLIMIGAVVIGLLVIGFIFARLYTRATKETAFVRTGLGGEKVIKDGGALVLPVVHEVIPVNMNTLRIEVEKNLQGCADHQRPYASGCESRLLPASST